MTHHSRTLLDADIRLAWRRFRGKATAEQMRSWINHNFQRGYEADTFADYLEQFRSDSTLRITRVPVSSGQAESTDGRDPEVSQSTSQEFGIAVTGKATGQNGN